MKRNWMIGMILSLSASPAIAAQPAPELRRCIVPVIWRNGVKPYNMKLISVGVAWYDKAWLTLKSDHVIEMTGVSGRVYIAYCNMGSRFIGQDEPRTNTISAAVPCDEDGVGYRIKNITTGEIVGEEWFGVSPNPTITLDLEGTRRGRVRVEGIAKSFSAQSYQSSIDTTTLTPQKGTPTSVSIHFSFDGGQTWVNNTGSFNARKEVPFEIPATKREQDQSVIAEVQVAVGLRMYRQRFQLGEKAVPLSMKGVPEIRHEN